jgi:microcystin-dependent protein
MSDPYIGEIRMFGGDYAPVNWHFCDGALLNISDYSALFSLLGTTYGGNGTTNFALPDLRGRLPIGQGPGPGLTPRTLGAKGGVETVALTDPSQVGTHGHTVHAATAPGSQASPAAAVWASHNVAKQYIARTEIKSPAITHVMNSVAIGNSAGGAAHDNVMPSFPISFIIALQGEFPTQNG